MNDHECHEFWRWRQQYLFLNKVRHDICIKSNKVIKYVKASLFDTWSAGLALFYNMTN